MAATQVLTAMMRRRLAEAGLTAQADRLALLGAEHVASSADVSASVDLPVLAHLPAALEAARGVLSDPAAAALTEAATGAAWTQTAAYVARPPGPGFLDGYAHATLAGPRDGSPDGQPDGPPAALGLLLLGPGVHYPHHRHPADEVYLPLTAARWSHDEQDPLSEEPAGTLLHHRPEQAHAMATDGEPLLAVYVWTGEVTVASRWC